jgi:tetratricopeptide (TPR) repeat protein
MEETIYELMGWDEGYFKFEERTEIAAQRLLSRVRVDSLLMEGARRIDEWTRLESKVPGAEAVPVLAPVSDREASPLDLRTEEWEVLAEIDGDRDIRRLAADLGRSAFDVAKIIYGLVSTGVVQVSNRSSRIPEMQLKTQMAEVERLLTEDKVDQAHKIATDLEAAYPERAELAVLCGRTLAAQNRMRAATEAFSRAVSLDPLASEAHLRLGFTAVQTGDLDRAAKAWETFVRLSSNGERTDVVTTGLDAIRTLINVLEYAPVKER